MPPKVSKKKKVHVEAYYENQEDDELIPAPVTDKKKKNASAKVVPYEANTYAGIEKNRKCRDVPCCFLYVAMLIVMALITSSALQNGNPQQLIVPRDYLGNYCGIDNPATSNATQAAYKNQTGKPYLYYFDPLLLTERPYICVASCPNVTRLTTTASTVLCTYDKVPADDATAVKNTFLGACTSYTYSSSPVIGRCVLLSSMDNPPANLTSISTPKSATDVLNAGRDVAAASVADIAVAWPAIVVGMAVTIVLCFIWLFLLQILSGVIVWVSVIGINLIFTGAAVWLYFYWSAAALILSNYTNKTNTTATGLQAQISQVAGIDSSVSLLSQSDVNAIMYTFYVLAAVAGILILITIAMARRIAIAVQVLKVASQACLKMPLIVFFPLLSWSFIAGFLIHFVYVGIYLITPSSSPQPWTLPGGTNVQFSGMDQLLPALHIFGFLWSINFVMGFSQVTLAGAIASWYWMMDKTQKLRFPVMKSAKRTCKFHLGSVALGSILLAIVLMIRIIFYQATKQLVGLKKNPLIKYIVSCVECCLKCITMIIKFINKNAYIYIAITGKSFFESAGAATSLLMRNAAKTVAIDFVSNFILFISKLLVAGVIGFATYYYLSLYGSQLGSIRNPYVLVVFSSFASFFVASLFFGTYEMAIDTIFLCALDDVEKNDGSKSRPYFMPDRLRKVMGLSENADTNEF